MKEFKINNNDAGQRLDRFVAKAVPLLPGSTAQKYIRIKRIKVCGKGARRDYLLREGDVVQMYVNDEFFMHECALSDICHANASADAGKHPAAPHGLDIVYEDENILLVNKQAGMLCHSDGGCGFSSVIAQVRSYLHLKNQWDPRMENSFAPALCNRIDRNTSGIVIAAKNAMSLRIINEKIRLREIDKYYLAAVHGTPLPASGMLDGYLYKDAEKNQALITHVARPGSKRVQTEYTTLVTSGNLTLLECRLITGRTHQIRAQLYDIGHPLLGDIKYGGWKSNMPYGERRQALCAYKLSFSFVTDAQALSYLGGRSFQISDVPFVSKYFQKLIDI